MFLVLLFHQEYWLLKSDLLDLRYSIPSDVQATVYLILLCDTPHSARIGISGYSLKEDTAKPVQQRSVYQVGVACNTLFFNASESSSSFSQVSPYYGRNRKLCLFRLEYFFFVSSSPCYTLQESTQHEEDLLVIRFIFRTLPLLSINIMSNITYYIWLLSQV